MKIRMILVLVAVFMASVCWAGPPASPPSSGTVAVAGITDASANGRSLISAVDYNAMLVLFGSSVWNTAGMSFTGAFDINPAGVGAADIISIVPSAVLTTNAVTWRGIAIDGASMDPSGNDVKLLGIEVDLSGVVPTGSGFYMEALELKMPSINYNAIDVETGRIKIDNDLPATAGAEFSAVDIRVGVAAMNAASSFHAIDVSISAGTPSGDVAALGTHGDIAPIQQSIGTFSTPTADEYQGRKTTGGTAWADNIDTLEIFIVDDDAIYVGSAATFNELEVDMTTGATRNVIPTFWYNTAADTWTQFYPQDDTDGFKQDGKIRWTLDDISGAWTNDGDPGAADSSAGYWIKIVRTVNADPGTPTPATVKTGVITSYGWDKTGAITALNVSGAFTGTVSLTPQSLEVTTEANIALTGSLLLLTGDDDTDNDAIDLQNGTTPGQLLYIVAVALVDANDTITVAMTDTTCTGCLTVLLDEIGDTWGLVWTGSTWATITNSEVP